MRQVLLLKMMAFALQLDWLYIAWKMLLLCPTALKVQQLNRRQHSQSHPGIIRTSVPGIIEIS